MVVNYVVFFEKFVYYIRLSCLPFLSSGTAPDLAYLAFGYDCPGSLLHGITAKLLSKQKLEFSHLVERANNSNKLIIHALNLNSNGQC